MYLLQTLTTETVAKDSVYYAHLVLENTLDAKNWSMVLMNIWIGFIIVLFLFLLFKYPLKDWGKEGNPYQKETLGMPRGIFRGLLTLSVLFIVIILEVNTLFFDISQVQLTNGEAFSPEKRFEQLMIAFQMIIAFYFGGKAVHHATSVSQRKAEYQQKVDMKRADSEGVG